MATKQMIERDFQIKSADTYSIGDVGDGKPGVLVVHLQGALWAGTIKVKARAQGSDLTFVQVPYKKLHLNGSAADASQVSTDITADSIIAIDDATGLEVALDCTTYNSGTMKVRVRRGAAV